MAAALSGCAGYRSIVPQQSNASDVRARLQMPTDIRFAPNGDELWEYATGPMGTETYLVRIGKDGQVVDTTQLLTTERLEKIVPGATTNRQVRRLLGRPSDVAYFNGLPVWEWRANVGPTPGRFIVRFDRAGVVIDRMVLMDSTGDDSRDEKGETGK